MSPRGVADDMCYSNWSTGTGSEDLDFTVTTEALRTVMRKAASSAIA